MIRRCILICVAALLAAVGAAAPASPSMVSSRSMAAKDMVRASVAALESTPSGRIWMAVKGSADGGADALSIRYSDNGGKSFKDGAGLFSCPCGVATASLWASPDGSLVLFVSDSSAKTWAVRCSNPSGNSPIWGEPSEIGEGYVTACPVAAGGTYVLPYALMGAAGVYTSSDGLSWAKAGAVVKTPSLAPTRADATALAMPDGSIKLVMRGSDNGLTCWAWEAASTDAGASWTKVKKFIDNPDQPLCVKDLGGGKWLMVKNCLFDRMTYVLPEKLLCYLSDDCGNTWYGEMLISSDDKAVNPHACVDRDGNILIAYDYDPSSAGEIRLLTTSQSQIASVWGNLQHEDFQGKVCLKAGKCASFAAAEIKRLFPPKKNWADKTLMIGTYNIQYAIEGHKNFETVWRAKRLPALAKIFEAHPFDIVGTQEPFLAEIEDMMAMKVNDRTFGDIYSWVGAPISGKEVDRSCHYDPIFYRKDRLECLEWGIEWFTPVPGKAAYGAWSSRHCCWGHFKDLETGKEFFCINSHTDHLGEEARRQSSHIIVNLARRICGGLPCFFTGDFNADEASMPYKIIMDSGFIDDSLLSVYNPVNAEYFSMSHYKPMSTVRKSGKHIDHVFYTFANSKILSWKLITDSYNDYFGSDHLPIICEWKIAN